MFCVSGVRVQSLSRSNYRTKVPVREGGPLTTYTGTSARFTKEIIPMSAPRPVLAVGVLGAGTVGSQVIRILQSSREDFAARSGAEMEVRRVLVRNVDAPRDSPIDRELLTTDPAEAIDGMDLVVELIGGIEPARTFVLRALTQGISVVTGNKALLAAHGPELYEAAASNDADLYYEAAVAGAVPVVYGLRESLAGDRVTTVMGIGACV